MENYIQNYFDNTQQPWGIMFYDIIQKQLQPYLKYEMRILDFGSGFGIISNFLAKDCNVIAVEPNEKMIELSAKNNIYGQVVGSIDVLSEFETGSFDMIICHNVLEYVEKPEDVFDEFNRLLKVGGIISLVKHNEFGRVMEHAVFEANPQKALTLIDNKLSDNSELFGPIKLYSLNDITKWTKDMSLKVENLLGLRTFYALIQINDIKFDPYWHSKMLELELSVADKEPYKSIGFYNHIIMKKM